MTTMCISDFREPTVTISRLKTGGYMIERHMKGSSEHRHYQAGSFTELCRIVRSIIDDADQEEGETVT